MLAPLPAAAGSPPARARRHGSSEKRIEARRGTCRRTCRRRGLAVFERESTSASSQSAVAGRGTFDRCAEVRLFERVVPARQRVCHAGRALAKRQCVSSDGAAFEQKKGRCECTGPRACFEFEATRTSDGRRSAGCADSGSSRARRKVVAVTLRSRLTSVFELITLNRSPISSRLPQPRGPSPKVAGIGRGG
jgi:hypothetical protein